MSKVESRRPLAEFDAVGFSLQYELTFTNLLNILDLSGIPLRSSDREEGHPFVLAGGPVATQPEPVAPFVDVFLIGDAQSPRWISEAVFDGHRLAREIDLPDPSFPAPTRRDLPV